MPLKPQNTSSAGASSFDKSMTEDISGFHKKPNDWTQARNAVNNTEIGDIGLLSNEQSNQLCVLAPYTIIGIIHIEGDKFTVMSTDNTDSEIGLFDESECSYTTLANDPCLNFHTDHLIIGQSKENFECKWEIYWADGNNPDRVFNIDDIPWIQDCVDDNGQPIPNPDPNYVPIGCITCTDTSDLDCEKMRLEPLIDNLKFSVAPGATSGEMMSGSYYVVGAYTINGQKFCDYSAPSQVQGLWTHQNSASSIDVNIEFADPRFDEFELVLLTFINYQQVAKKVGSYSTRQKMITLDQMDPKWIDVNPGDILLNSPIDDKSDSIWRNGEYLLRIGPTSKFDFNYQPRANQIKAQWLSVEYPEYYYGDGGNNTGYMRDELYAFFIRWVYNTGDKSPSFHIPGRHSIASDLPLAGGRDAAVDIDDGLDPYNWRVNNTASVDPAITPYTLPDGGQVLGGGDMAYWESSEKYDDDTPQIWNGTYTDPNTGVNIGDTADTRYDLCGKEIRHHKFPSNQTDPTGHPITHHVNSNGTKIRVMGVQFSNIKLPVDNAGNEIRNVVGYEILRGSREGNKSIFYKGIINNMREYEPLDENETMPHLYQNYPYNDLGPDPYLQSNRETFALGGTHCLKQPLTAYRKDNFSFHSPDTNFKDPYLSAKELKIYGQVNGNPKGFFQHPAEHPEHKLLTDASLITAALVGLIYPLTKTMGNKEVIEGSPKQFNLGSAVLGVLPNVVPFDQVAVRAPTIVGFTAYGAANLAVSAPASAVSSVGALVGQNSMQTAFNNPGTRVLQNFPTGTFPGTIGGDIKVNYVGGDLSSFDFATRTIFGTARNIFYWMEGIDLILAMIRAAAAFRQYALQHVSHCKYDGYTRPIPDNTRRAIAEQSYIGPALTNTPSTRINNVFRNRFVNVETGATVPNNRIVDNPLPSALLQGPLSLDNSKYTLGEIAGNPVLDPGLKPENYQAEPISTVSQCHYAALKQRIRNQYGQLNGIIQVPVTYGTTPKNNNTDPNNPLILTSTNPLFNGDIYVGRYTEKTTMFFFYDWLYGQPDGYEYNYYLRQQMPWASYWADTDTYDIAEFLESIDLSDIVAALSLLFGGTGPTIAMPSMKFCLDKISYNTVTPTGYGAFVKKNAYFYLFNSGVRDFFVESEVNVDYRDWGDEDKERHYDEYRFTHLPTIFNAKPEIIKAGNYFKYDWSLSVARLYNNFYSWGAMQDPQYDPEVAETCYTYRPNRITYSLPQNMANKKDFWRVWLPYNYKDFTSRPTAVKQFSKNGAMILFNNMSPVTFAGQDVLTTDGDTKLVIGDGGLFSQALQHMANADWPIEYGSCQDKFSALNTPAGFYYISQNQGKVFTLGGNNIQEISNIGMKWWFAQYLPYKLTKDFPDFELVDNPVAGIGCQTIYDNKNQVVYFCKKDYQLKKDLPENITITYSGESDIFYVNGRTPIILGDPLYFDTASWTVSYDPKSKAWISYHDWHPDLTASSKNTFMSTKKEGVWIHNQRCDSYCNFYGDDYPFEVEFSVHTGNVVNTLRSIEYFMEAFKYAENCYDRFHDLDFNFDEAIIYNTEQVSGLLKLNLSPKNDAPEIVTYPKTNVNSYDILYSKVEQKYRFNQFWDTTDDRGEFNAAAERTVFNTEPNGYIRNLNINNLNYNKPQIERKKFRHYKNTVFLRRKSSGDRNMIVSTAIKMNLKSPR